MNDRQQDIISEIRAIGELLQSVNESATISSASLSFLGELLLEKCREIEE